MKKILQFSIIISCLSLLGISTVFGQSYPIQITMIKKPPHLFRFDDVDDFSDQLFVSAVNTSKEPVSFNLNFIGTGPNGLTIKADMVLDDPIELEPGEVMSITGKEFEQFGIRGFTQDIVLPAKERDFLVLGRLLREGRYTICLTATSPINSKKFLSHPKEGCDYFDIVYGEPPYIVLPENKQTITGTDPTLINIAWTHNSFGAPHAYDYTVKMIDITPYTKYDPIELMERPGIPVIHEEEISGSFFVGLTDLDLENKHVYAIRITVSDPDKNMEFESGGKSNVVLFEYIENEMPGNDKDVPTTKDDDTSIADNCDCSISLPQPSLLITKPDSTGHPRKLKIDDLEAYGSYLLACNSNYDESTHDITYTVNWTSSVSNTSEEHDFSASEALPSEFCIDFAIRLKNRATGNAGCDQTVCLNVADDLLDVAPDDVTTGEVIRGDTIYAGINREFQILTTTLTQTGDTYAGTGDVFVGWLQGRVKVKFDNITVDEDKHILNGAIYAVISDDIPTTYPTAWATEAAARNTWTNNLAGDVVNWIEGNSNRSLPYKSPSHFTTPITMPLGVIFSDDNQFAITEMSFTRNRSKFNLIAAKTTPANWGAPKTIGFKAVDVKFHHDDIEFPPRKLDLVADLSSTMNELTFTLKAPTAMNDGCFIQWDENGFSLFGLELESTVSRNWMVPANDDGVRHTRLLLSAQGNDWDELLFTGNLEKSEIVGSGGIKITAENISYDMSDVINPPGIVFPSADYVEQSPLFKGFFAKTIRIELPEMWETGSNGPLEIVAENMIIDNFGVSMNVTASNVVDFNDASVIGMAASVDGVRINIRSNRLEQALINGKLVLPITDPTNANEQSRVNYSATLNVAADASTNTNFSFLITPRNNQIIDFSMINSKLNLGNSSFSGYVDKDKTTFDLSLNGKINIVDLSVGPLSMNSLEMNVLDLGVEYDSSDPNSTLKFNIGTWAFNSPQKSLVANGSSSGGFTFNIDDIDFVTLPSEGEEYLRGKINFNIYLNLAGDLVGGYTKIGVLTAIDKGTGFAKYKPRYLSTKLEEISVEADLGPASIRGLLKIRDNDPVFGDGFLGEIEASFKVPEASANATVEFGTVNNYRYWRVQAGARFATPILFAGGFGFKGFGGGAYYNMKSVVNQRPDPVKLGRDNFIFTPQDGTIGMSIKAVIVASKEETFNSDVTISGEFQGSGMKFIDFQGLLWMGAGIPDRNDATIKGNVNVHYDFVDKIFSLNSAIVLDRSPLYSRSSLNVLIDPDKWFVKFGDPNVPNTVSVSIGSLSLPVQSYLMFGSEIPIPKNFTTRFSDGYAGALGHPPRMEPVQTAASEGSNARKGAGIAMGIGFDFEAEGYVPVVGSYYAGVKGSAGAELNLSLLEYPQLKQRGLGLNGWQAGGSIGFYASLDAGAYKKSGRNYIKKFTVANFAGGGYVTGRFPNPTWAQGEVAGKIKVGCAWRYCLIDCGASIGFEYGREVDPGPPDVAVTEAVVDHNTIEVKDHIIDRMEKEIVQYIRPNVTGDFKVSDPIRVKYNVAPNFEFEVTDKDNKIRVFKFETEIYLMEQNPLSCGFRRLDLWSDVNDDGEYLYTAHTQQDYNYMANAAVDAAAVTNTVYSLAELSTFNTTRFDYEGSSGSSSSNVPVVNHLAPETFYRFAISFELKELISGYWEKVRFNNEYVSEVRTFGFKTESVGYLSVEKTSCNNMYHKMTVDEWRQLSEVEKDALRDTDGHFYISDDGLCECPRRDADEKQQTEDTQEALDAISYKIGQSKNLITPGELRNMMDGLGQPDIDQGFDSGSPQQYGGENGASGAAVYSSETVYSGGVNTNAVNAETSGSFGGFQNMDGKVGSGMRGGF